MNINYRELEIYRLAHSLVLETYEMINCFPQCEDNNLTSQFRRAVTCLPLNIAEGSGSRSFKIFLNYLVFCYRSCLETEAALRLARDLKYVSASEYDAFFEKLDGFIRRLWRYMEYVESNCGYRKKDQSYFYKHQKYNLNADFSRRNRMGSLC